MSKAFPASCLAGVVTVDGLPLLSATVLSEGIAASNGVAVLDGEESFYLAQTSGDLKTTLENLSTAIDQISQALNHTATALSLHDGIVGPVAAADIAAIATSATTLISLKASIDVFKEALA